MKKKIEIPLYYRFPFKLDLLIDFLVILFILIFIIVGKWPAGKPSFTECTVLEVTASHNKII